MRLAQWIIIGTASIVMMWCTSSDIKLTLQEAQQYEQQGNYREALGKIERSLQEHPTSKKLLTKRTELLFLTEQYEQFVQERPGLSRTQKKKNERSYLLALMKSGDPSAAYEKITLLLEKNPTSDLYQLKWQAEYLQWNYDEAIRSYDEALRLDPTFVDAIINKAVTLADAGQLFESLALLDQWIALYPDEYLLRYNKWTVLSDLGYQQRNVAGTWSFSYYGDALRHFEKAYRLRPTDQNTIIWLWITYLDLSQYKKAHQALQTVLSTNPHAYDAWYYEAKTYTAEGNSAEAKKTYEELLRLNPSYELAQQELILLEKKAQ